MTCRGYDPKAVSLPKALKRQVGYELDAHKRGAIIASYVEIYKSQLRSGRPEAKNSN
jgi:hypothetical protein